MGREVLRLLALEALLAAPTTEFRHPVNAVAGLAADRNIPCPEYTAEPERSFYRGRRFHSETRQLCRKWSGIQLWIG